MNRFHTFTKNESSDESSEEGELNDDSDDHNDQKPAIDGKDNHQLFDSKALKVSKSLEIMDKRDDNRAKNRFTLWSDILLEEELNHSVSNSMDIKKRQKKSTKFDRKSENYSFWTKKQLEDKQKDNCDQQLTQTTDNSDNKQTKSEKKRRKNKKKKKKADKDIVSQIAYKLNEPKTDLLKTVYETIGPEKTSELCSAALDVQSSGGLMTADGKRRRTCGGVFFHLLKNDSRLTKETIDYIFFNEKQEFKSKKFKQKVYKKSLKRKGKGKGRKGITNREAMATAQQPLDTMQSIDTNV